MKLSHDCWLGSYCQFTVSCNCHKCSHGVTHSYSCEVGTAVSQYAYSLLPTDNKVGNSPTYKPIYLIFVDFVNNYFIVQNMLGN